MRHSFVTLIIFCGLAVANSAQQSGTATPEQAQTQQPNAEKHAAGPEAPKPENNGHDYSRESFVIEKMHSTYRFDADGTGRKETVARIRVQSEAGVQQWGQLQEGYNSASERVEIPSVRVLKQDGAVVKAGEDAVQDLSAPIEREAPVYTDYRQKHITVPGLRPGEVLEYDMVTVIHTPLAAGQFWADYEFDKNNIDLDESLDVDVPAGRTLKLKRSEEHTSELQSHVNLVCRLLLEKKKKHKSTPSAHYTAPASRRSSTSRSTGCTDTLASCGRRSAAS